MNDSLQELPRHGEESNPRAHGLRSTVGGRWMPLVAAALAGVLTVPSLWVGWVADDHFQRLRLVGSEKLPEIPADPARFFTFADGDPQHTLQLMDRGIWPWWTYPDIQASFWRPISVLTHQLDYALWPKRSLLMHAHSIAWLALLAGLTALLYRRMMGATWVAGLAALLYAIDEAHGMPVGFLANRNALVATAFGVAAILAHDRWRRASWKPGVLVAPLLFAASLLSAEIGVGALAYLVAHAVVLDPAPRRSRILVVALYVAIVVMWRIAWELAGAGIEGVGSYVDPLTEPVRFIMEAIKRAPILLLGQWAWPGSEASQFTKEFGWLALHWAVAVCVLIFLSRVIWPVVRSNQLAQFWALGMVLAVVPICATFCADRLLLFVGLGAFALMATFLARPPQSKLARYVRTALVVVHVALAPVLLVVRAALPVGPKRIMEGFLVPPITDPAVERQTVVLVTAPLVLGASYLSVNQALAGLPVPKQVRFLSTYQPPVEIHRQDEHTLVMRPAGGFLKSQWDQLARNDRYPMLLGQRVELPGMTAEITSLTADGRPAEVAFFFEVPLEDSSIRWLTWRKLDSRLPFGRGHFEPFSLPAVGETMILGKVAAPHPDW